MDYKRAERNITYHTPSCKMYLRHDFKHKCAYCGVSEDIVSNIPDVAEMIFEKDHFLPQDSKSPNIHKYFNLFYACQKCNGIKDNVLLPLNPCVDSIFTGSSPNISGGTAETGYCVESSTPSGNDYINKLQLNSRYHVELRECQAKHLARAREAEQILLDLQSNSKLTPTQVSIIASAIKPENNIDPIKQLCGSSSYGKHFIDAYYLLERLGYSCEIVFEGNELDIVVVVAGVKYYGQLRITSDIQNCQVSTSVLRTWQQKHVPCGVMQYITSSQQIRFHAIDFGNVNWKRKTYSAKSFMNL